MCTGRSRLFESLWIGPNTNATATRVIVVLSLRCEVKRLEDGSVTRDNRLIRK